MYCIVGEGEIPFILMFVLHVTDTCTDNEQFEQWEQVGTMA